MVYSKYKCKVLRCGKCGVLYGMDFRMSVDSHVFPYGLHREWWVVFDVDLLWESGLEDGCRWVKYRRCKCKYGF